MTWFAPLRALPRDQEGKIVRPLELQEVDIPPLSLFIGKGYVNNAGAVGEDHIDSESIPIMLQKIIQFRVRLRFGTTGVRKGGMERVTMSQARDEQSSFMSDSNRRASRVWTKTGKKTPVVSLMCYNIP